MNDTTNTTAAAKVHKFELAGLGKAPFQFKGITENVFVAHPGATPRAGGSCDYCGTNIRDEFHLLSADGKAFKVGCDCIGKAGDSGLLNIVKRSPEYRAAQRAKAQKKAAAVLLSLIGLRAANERTLAAMPHPRGFVNKHTQQPLSFLDFFNWTMDNAGAYGRDTLLKFTRRELAKVEPVK